MSNVKTLTIKNKKSPADALKKWKKIPPEKKYLKQRVSVVCSCNSKRSEKDRAKYGVSRCDSYSFSWSVGIILSNALYQYLADAKPKIVRDDWDIIEKHANAIREYTEADSWDKMTTSDDGKKTAITRMIDYEKKEQAWREAMFWLTENWISLWW